MSDINPNKVYEEYLTTGQEWADKRGAADLLEGTLKCLKAKLALDARSIEKCGLAEAENIALASLEYGEALEASVEARRVANRANVKYIATQALFEARRTAEASHRAAMRSAT